MGYEVLQLWVRGVQALAGCEGIFLLWQSCSVVSVKIKGLTTALRSPICAVALSNREPRASFGKTIVAPLEITT